MKNNIQEKRNKLIERLIAFHVYKKEDKHLYELTLSELEKEYGKFFSNNHPHDEFGSIRWYSK